MIAADDFNWSDEDGQDLIRKIFGGEVTLLNLPVGLYKSFGSYLAGGVFKSFNLDFDTNIMVSEYRTVQKLVENTYVFSSAKTFQQIKDMQSQLYDNGFIRPFKEFEKRAAAIQETYIGNWLKAEYRTTINMSRSAKNWDRYTEQANTFPYLRYQTKSDSKVRNEHQTLHGITRKVGDEFWQTYMPPNGWNCRCTIVQVRNAKETPLVENGKDKNGNPVLTKNGKPIEYPQPLFNFNPGEGKIIFNDKQMKGVDSHPYFKVDQRYEAFKSRNFDLPLPFPIQ